MDNKDNIIIINNDVNELTEKEKTLKDSLMNITENYKSLLKVLDITFDESDNFIDIDSITEMAISTFITAIYKKMYEYMGIEK